MFLIPELIIINSNYITAEIVFHQRIGLLTDHTGGDKCGYTKG